MVLQRWEPFAELRRMDDRVGRLWRGFGSRYTGEHGTEAWGIPLDVSAESDTIAVKASLPGVEPGNISVNIEDGVLTIKGSTESESQNENGNGKYLMRERRYGSFHRSMRLPDTVDTENVKSAYKNGVLTVEVPKLESKKARKVEVKIEE